METNTLAISLVLVPIDLSRKNENGVHELEKIFWFNNFLPNKK